MTRLRPLLFALLVAASGRAAAQTTKLTLGGFTGNIGTTAITDWDNGFKDSGSATTYTALVQNTLPAVPRNITVFIRSASGTFGATSKPIADLMWRRNDILTWTSLTTSDAQVDAGTNISGNGSGLSNSVWFRCILNWTDNPTATYSVSVIFTMTVTAP